MSSINGGRWIFSAPDKPIVLGINNGVAPVFPTPQSGAVNIEVFTNSTVSGLPDHGNDFQWSIADPGGTLDAGFLTGTNLTLGGGIFLAVDSVVGGSRITLTNGNQTVVGAKGDTIIGGSGDQILSALLGNETVIAGTGNTSIWGGANNSIVAGTQMFQQVQQIVVTGTGTTVVAGMSGLAIISLADNNTVTALPGGGQSVVIAAGVNNKIDMTGHKGSVAVIGKPGDTITGGSGTSIDGTAGGMLINAGTAGVTALSGSTTSHNTVKGGTGNFNFNPGPAAGSGDLIDLSGSTGLATINAFAFGNTRIASPDTIFATNNGDSIFGGDGDRISTSKGSVVGGFHQWTHSDTVAGASVGFGTNDTVSSTSYDTVNAFASRNPTVPGTSSAQVTISGFNTTTDFLFYQNETVATTSAIIATARPVVSGHFGSVVATILVLPDGTTMNIVGLAPSQLTPALFKL